MSDVVLPTCPMCKQVTVLHCAENSCGWLVCKDCETTFGPRRAFSQKMTNRERKKNGKG